MRITVHDVLGYLASGMSECEILHDFPGLTREDLLACLAFAAGRERRLAALPVRSFFSMRVTKNADFRRRRFLPGRPPKFNWLRVGICSTQPESQS